MSADRVIGPQEAAALALPLERGSKRAHVAHVLGRLLDERPTGDPSISALARGCRRHRMEAVFVLDRLIDEGHVLLIHRGDKRRCERSVYSINDHTHTKENTPMTTKTTTTTATEETPIAPAPPAWQLPGFWPTLVKVTWPALDQIRTEHDSAAESVAEARAAGDADAERTALLALAEGMIAADRSLRDSFAEAHAAFRDDLAGVSAYGPGDRVPDGDLARHRADLAGAREWADADGAAFERVRALIEQSVFVADFLRRPTEADHMAPAVSETVARATVLTRELSS